MRASASLTSMGLSFRRTSSRRARSSRICKSARSKDLSTNTWQRERRGVMTSKEGFSVVAPTSTMVPFSTAPRRASCCALLKRWISSIKRMGAPFCWKRELPRAFSNTSRTSFTPAVTADRVKNSRSRVFAIMCARVVFPTPGGPQRMKELRLPLSIICRKMQPSPTRWRWPTYWSSVAGRIRSGSGGNITDEALI